MAYVFLQELARARGVEDVNEQAEIAQAAFDASDIPAAIVQQVADATPAEVVEGS